MDGSTLGVGAFEDPTAERAARAVPALTVLCHPDPRRIGERAVLANLARGKAVALARAVPLFSRPGTSVTQALDDAFVSREPIEIRPASGRFRLRRGESSTHLVVDGKEVEAELEIPSTRLAQGVVLELSRRVALLLHDVQDVAETDPRRFDLVGDSDALRRVREEIRRVLDLDTAVLIRGATGTGKEQVARAIHDAGPRRGGPFVAVNLGAIPPSLAAAELFGATRGAFTGAVDRQVGFFRRARGGTLFLDEIGEAPAEVQVLLLRAIETGEYHPLGAQQPERLDARLLAATDSDLEGRVVAGTFREPLIHRLSGYVIWLPRLAQRRDDVARLLLHFLDRELRAIGEAAKLEPTAEGKPWLPAELVSRLVRAEWSGNVRQLANVARQLVIGSRGLARLSLSPEVERLLEPGGGHAGAAAGGATTAGISADAGGRKPSELGRDELRAALVASRFDLAAAARRLGISRPSLYNQLRRFPDLRPAGELSADALRSAFIATGGDLTALVERLEVSEPALRRRLRDLGLL